MGKKPRYKVIVSGRARQMLAGHVRFMAQKNPSAAREVKNQLMDAIRSLHQMPERCPFLNADFWSSVLKGVNYETSSLCS